MSSPGSGDWAQDRRHGRSGRTRRRLQCRKGRCWCAIAAGHEQGAEDWERDQLGNRLPIDGLTGACFRPVGWYWLAVE